MSDQDPDMALAVEFYNHAVEHPRKSKEEGRPIFEDKEFVRIRFPGDNKRELCAPAHEMHYNSHAGRQMTYAERFQKVYQAFKEQNSEMVNGTPLSELPALTEARRSELRAFNVTTVEQLAGLTDSAGRKIGMHWREMSDAAQAYLKAASDTGEVAALRRQIEELKAQMGAPKPQEQEADLSMYEDDDLKNMIRDAGRELPRGKTDRAKLEAAVREIAAENEKAAA